MIGSKEKERWQMLVELDARPSQKPGVLIQVCKRQR
jgi:hypothetical protein